MSRTDLTSVTALYATSPVNRDICVDGFPTLADADGDLVSTGGGTILAYDALNRAMRVENARGVIASCLRIGQFWRNAIASEP